MKQSRILKVFVILLLLGCLVPAVSAKPKTISFKAIGKGTVTYQETDISAVIGMKTFVTPGGYTVESDGTLSYEGTADIVMRFVLPDGTKISAFKDVPFNVSVGDEGILGFKAEINGQFLLIRTFKEDGKLMGAIEGVKLTIGETKIIELNLDLKICVNAGLEASLIVQE